MPTRYSIADARDRLTQLVRQAERGVAVEVSRRGKPVAVLVSADEYLRLTSERSSFWSALHRFRRQVGEAGLAAGPDVFDKVRDRSRGRRVKV